MTVKERLEKIVQELPEEQQREVLDFAEFLSWQEERGAPGVNSATLSSRAPTDQTSRTTPSWVVLASPDPATTRDLAVVSRLAIY
jgi:hypothetical protein